MNRMTVLLFAVLMLFSLAACTVPNSPTISLLMPAETTPPSSDATDTVSEETKTKILIAYFTVPEPDGIDAVAQASRVVMDGDVLGNTQFIAQIVQRETGGELHAIETLSAYPPRPALMEIALAEKNQNARPELTTQIDNFADYDVVFLGYPIWNADMPMALYTFLEQYDFSGKTIIPFCPHGGSGFSDTIASIATMLPNASVLTDGFSVSRDAVPYAENDVVAWVKGFSMAMQ